MILCDTPGCYSSAAEDFSPLGCNTLSSGMWFRAFGMTVVFLCSRLSWSRRSSQ